MITVKEEMKVIRAMDDPCEDVIIAWLANQSQGDKSMWPPPYDLNEVTHCGICNRGADIDHYWDTCDYCVPKVERFFNKNPHLLEWMASAERMQ